jgi:hypothetical protein
MSVVSQRAASGGSVGGWSGRDLTRQSLPLFVLVALGLGVAIVFAPGYALAAAAAVPVALAVGRWPGRAAVLLLLWGTVKYEVLKLTPAVSGLLVQAEIATVVLVVLSAVYYLGRGKRLAGVRLGWFGIFGAFVASTIASSVLNRVDVGTLAIGLRSLGTMPLLAASLLVVARPDDFRLLRAGGVALTIAQVPIAMAQFAYGGLTSNVDYVNGTLGMGGSNSLGIWMLAAAAACFYVFVRGHGVRWLAGSGVFMVVIVMCGARLCILALPVVVLGLGIWALTRSDTAMVAARLVMSTALMTVLLVGVIAAVYSGYATAGVNIGSAVSDLNPSSLFARQNQIGDYSVPRFAYLSYGWDFLRERSPLWLLGTGPASAGSGAASVVQGVYDTTPFATGLRLISEGSATYASAARVVTQTNQFVSTLVEYGPVGLVLIMLTYVVAGFHVAHNVGRRDTGFGREALLVGAFPVLLVFATVGTLYGVTWEGLNIVGLAFWWVAVLSYAPQGEDGSVAIAGSVL